MNDKPAPQDAKKAIQLRIADISQLFDTLDPFPFPERDLDRDAEEFIVSWARELPREQPLCILIHMRAAEIQKQDPDALRATINRFFEYKAEAIGRDLNELFRIGRLSLLVGVGVLAGCLAATQAVARLTATPLVQFVQESLIIVGWVANWRPIETFLYDWWPLVRRRNLYRRLAVATVELKSY